MAQSSKKHDLPGAASYQAADTADVPLSEAPALPRSSLTVNGDIVEQEDTPFTHAEQEVKISPYFSARTQESLKRSRTFLQACDAVVVSLPSNASPSQDLRVPPQVVARTQASLRLQRRFTAPQARYVAVESRRLDPTPPAYNTLTASLLSSGYTDRRLAQKVLLDEQGRVVKKESEDEYRAEFIEIFGECQHIEGRRSVSVVCSSPTSPEDLDAGSRTRSVSRRAVSWTKHGKARCPFSAFGEAHPSKFPKQDRAAAEKVSRDLKLVDAEGLDGDDLDKTETRSLSDASSMPSSSHPVATLSWVGQLKKLGTRLPSVRRPSATARGLADPNPNANGLPSNPSVPGEANLLGKEEAPEAFQDLAPDATPDQTWEIVSKREGEVGRARAESMVRDHFNIPVGFCTRASSPYTGQFSNDPCVDQDCSVEASEVSGKKLPGPNVEHRASTPGEEETLSRVASSVGPAHAITGNTTQEDLSPESSPLRRVGGRQRTTHAVSPDHNDPLSANDIPLQRPTIQKRSGKNTSYKPDSKSSDEQSQQADRERKDSRWSSNGLQKLVTPFRRLSSIGAPKTHQVPSTAADYAAEENEPLMPSTKRRDAMAADQRSRRYHNPNDQGPLQASTTAHTSPSQPSDIADGRSEHTDTKRPCLRRAKKYDPRGVRDVHPETINNSDSTPCSLINATNQALQKGPQAASTPAPNAPSQTTTPMPNFLAHLTTYEPLSRPTPKIEATPPLWYTADLGPPPACVHAKSPSCNFYAHGTSDPGVLYRIRMGECRFEVARALQTALCVEIRNGEIEAGRVRGVRRLEVWARVPMRKYGKMREVREAAIAGNRGRERKKSQKWKWSEVFGTADYAYAAGIAGTVPMV